MRKVIIKMASFIIMIIICNCGGKAAEDKENRVEISEEINVNFVILADEQPPTNFTDDGGNITGIAVDMCKEIQKRIGNNDQINLVPWKRAYETALIKPNVIIYTMARTPEREEKFYWITKVASRKWFFITNSDFKGRINNLNDAKKLKSIGIIRGDVRQTFLLRSGFTNLEEADNYEQSILKLKGERVDAILYERIGLSSIIAKLGEKYKLESFKIHSSPNSSQSWIAMSKNGTSMKDVQLWQKTSNSIKADGTFQKIVFKWRNYLLQNYNIEVVINENTLQL